MQKQKKGQSVNTMLICKSCGHVIEDGEEFHSLNPRGEYWGIQCFENETVCPICYSNNITEAKRCDSCGESFDESQMIGNKCVNCFLEEADDIEMCYKAGSDCEEDVKINGFLNYMFTKEEINRILFEYLKEKEHKTGKINCIPFIMDDPYWFYDEMEMFKENEN